MQPQYHGNRTMAKTSGAVWLLLKQLDLSGEMVWR